MSKHSLSLKVGAAFLGSSLGLSLVTVDVPHAAFGISVAQAKGGGGDGGGSDRGGGRDNDRSADRGGGNGGGNGNNGGASEASARGQDRADRAREKEKAVEKATAEAVSAAGLGKGRSTGSVSLDSAVSASSLGRLNAAHALAMARANASPNSAVGQIATYEQAVLAGDMQMAAESLAQAANKSVDTAVVKAVNELLALETPPGFDEGVAIGAQDIQRQNSTTP